jgi:uroporphyrin-III C-methyltransferase/precorrin-2 dehydrogenase/sirohydrochlorin ferrochelatase
MEYLPLFFDLKKRLCLVVGGGAIALRKASLLARSGAVIRLVAPDILPELEALVAETGGECHFRPYDVGDMQGVTLVVSATDYVALNEQVAADAESAAIPVNVVDQPALCSFIFPSIVDRSPIVVAVSSGGQSPVLARLIRSRLEASLPASYSQLAEFVGGLRSKVREMLQSGTKIRRFWEDVLDSPISELVMAGKSEEAQVRFDAYLAESEDTLNRGEVYLVGAGPGDPDLLTFKALRLMQQAEVVVYDRLVSAPILDKTRKDAERIYVGKAMANHAVPQQDINQLLVDLALQGKRVVRLKGGDPFIFGRGGEEIELLAENKVPFQVVPGITAASGCASYSGIPLTHRDYAQSVRFVTGHLKNNTHDLNWSELVNTGQTVVFYMGLSGLATICRSLIEHGRSPQTPIALIQQGTTPDHKVYTGTLSSMPNLVKQYKVQAPTLIIVGEVVSLHDKLQWYKQSTEI